MQGQGVSFPKTKKKMTQDLIERIKKEMDLVPLKENPISDLQIREVEKELTIKFHNDFVKFIKIFGTVDVETLPIFSFEDGIVKTGQTITELTKTFREDYKEDFRSKFLDTSYVISFDGSGNPILINSSGQVMIIYHDCDEYKIFANSFSEFLEKILNKEFEDEW